MKINGKLNRSTIYYFSTNETKVEWQGSSDSPLMYSCGFKKLVNGIQISEEGIVNTLWFTEVSDLVKVDNPSKKG